MDAARQTPRKGAPNSVDDACSVNFERLISNMSRDQLEVVAALMRSVTKRREGSAK